MIWFSLKGQLWKDMFTCSLLYGYFLCFPAKSHWSCYLFWVQWLWVSKELIIKYLLLPWIIFPYYEKEVFRPIEFLLSYFRSIKFLPSLSCFLRYCFQISFHFLDQNPLVWRYLFIFWPWGSEKLNWQKFRAVLCSVTGFHLSRLGFSP